MATAVGGGTVLWELDARGVATVAFNRPEVNNAYNADMIRGVHEALDALGAARGCGRSSSAATAGTSRPASTSGGAAEVAQLVARENLAISRTTGETVRRLDTLPVPTVALVQGGCFGGGTGFVAACDVVIASEDAVFSISETRWGLMAGIILPQLCHAMGRARCAATRSPASASARTRRGGSAWSTRCAPSTASTPPAPASSTAS